MKTTFFQALVTVLIAAGALIQVATAQQVTPVSPEAKDFDFYRGVVRSFEPASGLSITAPDGKVRTFVIPKKMRVVSQTGKAVESSVIKKGTHVTVTVLDPDQAGAVPSVYKVVVAKPFADSPKRTYVEGLVLKTSDIENVIILKPDGKNTKSVSIIYNQPATEFVGGDGINVDEDQLQAGDRLLIYVAPQNDGGLMAERVIFLGESGDPNYLRSSSR